MERLPQEIVVDILSRIPVKSLVQSKVVCRAWRCLIEDPMLLNKHFCRMIDDDPSLILQSDHPIINQLYFSDFCIQNDDGNSLITKKLPMPPLVNSHFLGSCNGLLCFRDSDYKTIGLSIYNPFTRDYTELPKLTTTMNPRHVGVLGFGLDPTTQKYKVVEILYKQPGCGAGLRLTHTDRVGVRVPAASRTTTEGAVHILTLGCSTWRNLGNLPFHLMWQQSHVQVNGKLHWLSYPKIDYTNLIISFDLATEQFQEVPTPDSMAAMGFTQVVVLRGCLSAASYHGESEQLKVWVMKQYGVKESWSEEYNIGDCIPRSFVQDETQMYYYLYSTICLNSKCKRVLCLMRSGEILLEYSSRALVLYDPNLGTFKDLQVQFEGITKQFKVVVHAGTLNWIDSFDNL